MAYHLSGFSYLLPGLPHSGLPGRASHQLTLNSRINHLDGKEDLGSGYGLSRAGL